MEITLLDYLVFFVFVGGVALFGCSFYFRSRKGAAAFTAAEKVAEDAEKAVDARKLSPKQLDDLIKELTAEMKRASKNLDFEYAATLRDRIKEIQAQAKGVK